MNKINFISLTAGVALAMAFTLSCSGDDGGDDNPSSSSGGGGGSSSSNPGGDSSSSGGGGGVNSSELSNKQVYLVKDDRDEGISKIEESRDNGNVFLSIEYKVNGEWTKDKIPAGRIIDGKLFLDSLPSIGSKYSSNFEKFEGRCEDEDADEYYSSCESTLSYPPELSIYWDAEFSVEIPDKECDIRTYLVKSDKWSDEADLFYYSKDGTITGAETWTYRDEEETVSSRWNVSFSKGWNLMYSIREDNGFYSTNSRPSGSTVEWGLYCDGGH